MLAPVAGFVPTPVRIPALPGQPWAGPTVPNATGQEWPANPFAPRYPWWTDPTGRPPGDWAAANARPRSRKVQTSDIVMGDSWPTPVDIRVQFTNNYNSTALLRCSDATEYAPASSTASVRTEEYKGVTSFSYIGGITTTTVTCTADAPTQESSYAYTEIIRWTNAAGQVFETSSDYFNRTDTRRDYYYRSNSRNSAYIRTVNGETYAPPPIPLPPDWVQPDATPEESETQPEYVPPAPARPPIAPPIAPPVAPPEEEETQPPAVPSQPVEPGVTPAPSPVPIPPPVGIPGIPGTGTGTGSTPGTGTGGGGGGGGGVGIPGTGTGTGTGTDTGTGTRPAYEEDFLGNVIGQPGERPPATAEGTAQMLGKLEQKLRIVGELVEKIPTTPGGGGGGTDWGDLLQLLTQLLTAPYPAGSYQLGDPCNPDQQPVEAPWPAGVGEFAELRARVDALAALVAEHKKMGQPVCVKERQGKPVTVILREKR